MVRNRVEARLNARLQTNAAHPLVLALSGGGDSMALLVVAARWARVRGRRLFAVTIDHGLNSVSREWSRTCADVCASMDVSWIERCWDGDKPTTGLPAAARVARHALLAETAREAGAKVILLAHTADDIAEADWMRVQPMGQGGSTLGRLREWSPSPAWPQGRGLMLMRPMLEERRRDLRVLLRAADQNWVEDPANTNQRFGRSRARLALNPLPAGEGLRFTERSDAFSRPEGGREAAKGEGLELTGQAEPLTVSHQDDRFALVRSNPLPLGEGFHTSRTVSQKALASILVCAGGRNNTPRGDRFAALSHRLKSGQDFTATLAGARIVAAKGDAVVIGREPGDLRRRPTPEVALQPGRPAVWDGRYEVTAHEPGWTVTAALGRLARLSPADRAIVHTVPAWARGALPVLYREDGDVTVLAWRIAEVRCLTPRRLDLALSGLALGETTHEADLFDAIHGEMPPTDLFSFKDHKYDAPHGPPRDREA